MYVEGRSHASLLFLLHYSNVSSRKLVGDFSNLNFCKLQELLCVFIKFSVLKYSIFNFKHVLSMYKF